MGKVGHGSCRIVSHGSYGSRVMWAIIHVVMGHVAYGLSGPWVTWVTGKLFNVSRGSRIKRLIPW